MSAKPLKVDAKKYHKKYSKKRIHTKAYYKKRVLKRKHVRAYRHTSRDVGASFHTVNADYVEASGRCSCSLHGDYREHKSRFRNYCPFCGRHGTLRYEEGSTCPEGMWFCSRCDADFCLVHGKSHTSRARYLLR
ncbi:hypothetical protein ISG34_00225 [Methanothermobacter marburgensis]|nr:hypothetical protein ISG34_00225 [Methanothermobacter marburgensis]